jgi:hypothetical protein
MVFKDKTDGRETARFAADGRKIPLPDGVISYAGVVPEDDKQFVTAMMVGHSNARGELLNCSTCDVVGAFPRVPRPASSPRIYVRFPSSLPHPFAGGYLEIKGALYGLRESSRLFQIEMIKVLKSAGFLPTPSSPMTFLSVDPDDKNLKSISSLVVDDIRSYDNCPPLTRRLHDAVRTRFGEITTTTDTAMFAGIEQVHTIDKGVLSIGEHQSKYIVRMANNFGITHMPPVLELSMPDFYEYSSTAEDCRVVDCDLYKRLIGSLIVVLKTRHEIRPFVSHLSRQTVPNAGDESKAI